MVLASILGELLEPLIEFLKCLGLWFLGALEWLALTVANLLIAAVMGLVSVVLAILPEVELSHLTLPPFLAWVNYLFPMEYFITVALVVLGIEITWWLVKIGLRWARAVGG
jgi:hypothetical protein